MKIHQVIWSEVDLLDTAIPIVILLGLGMVATPEQRGLSLYRFYIILLKGLMVTVGSAFCAAAVSGIVFRKAIVDVVLVFKNHYISEQDVSSVPVIIVIWIVISLVIALLMRARAVAKVRKEWQGKFVVILGADNRKYGGDVTEWIGFGEQKPHLGVNVQYREDGEKWIEDDQGVLETCDIVMKFKSQKEFRSKNIIQRRQSQEKKVCRVYAKLSRADVLIQEKELSSEFPSFYGFIGSCVLSEDLDETRITVYAVVESRGQSTQKTVKLVEGFQVPAIGVSTKPSPIALRGAVSLKKPTVSEVMEKYDQEIRGLGESDGVFPLRVEPDMNLHLLVIDANEFELKLSWHKDSVNSFL